MSQHPYYILQDLLEHARHFCEIERDLVAGVPPSSPFPFLYSLHQIEVTLARSGGRCLHFWGEFGDRTSQMEPKPFPLHVSRSIDEIAEAIRGRLVRWQWGFLLFSSGMSEIDKRLKAHHNNKYLPLLDAALSWRSARGVATHRGADALADKAMRLRVKATMTPEEGERVIWDRHREWYMSPALGDAIPAVSADEHESLESTIGEVWAYFGNLIPPERLTEEAERLAAEVRGTVCQESTGEQCAKEDLGEQSSDLNTVSTSRVLALDEGGRGLICIELEGATIREGLWSNPNRTYGYRYNLFFTKCKRWVKGHQQVGSGYEPAPHFRERGISFEVLTPEEAVAWCAKNYHPHPPELLDAFDSSLRPERESAQQLAYASQPCGGSAQAHKHTHAEGQSRTEETDGSSLELSAGSTPKGEVEGEKTCVKQAQDVNARTDKER
jgi:hypothetical protein